MSKKLVFNPANGQIELQNFIETTTVEGRVTNFAALPTASGNTGDIYIVESDSGSVFLLNKKEAGMYRSNGTTWESFSDVSAYSIETDNTNLNAPEANVQSALNDLRSDIDAIPAAITTWRQLATQWDSAPTVNKTISGGTVYNYIYNSVTTYRFVPTAYDPTNDTFYSSFDNVTDTLTTPIASRGV